ncbi:MAG: hypothetical protein K6T94_26410 [Paenibacillus sp.]|nr:hypothetical protein [Paenibacillus sp.]
MSVPRNKKSFGIIAMPKPFKGHIGVIQRNSIGSWVNLVSPNNIVLCGTEEGCAETALLLGTRYNPEVARNEYGTPLLNGLFKIGENLLQTDLICFVNSDIMFTSRLLKAVEIVSGRWNKFLLVGRRINLDLREPWDFSQPDWEISLEAKADKEGELFTADGIDYFIFPRSMWGEIPPFAIGRPAFDNWLIYRARSLRVPVIDATRVIMAIHQNHDYSHYSGGKAAVWDGPEAQRNRELAGGWNHIFDIFDATWLLTPSGLKRGLSGKYIRRRFIRLPVLYPTLGCFVTTSKSLLNRAREQAYRVLKLIGIK